MRIAAFDFGSNALKCLVCETEGQDFSILAEGRLSTRLGSAITPTGTLPEESIIQTLESCKQLLADYCKPHGVQLYLAAGTQALRLAKNAADLRTRLFQQTGIQLQIVSAETEARLTWLGAMQHQKGILALIDSGGASTEISFGSDSRIAKVISLPLGAVNLTKGFLKNDPPTELEISLLRGFINESLPDLPHFAGKLIGSGGGITACAKVALGTLNTNNEKLQGYRLDQAELLRQERLYLSLPLTERRAIQGLEPERADIITAFCVLLVILMREFKAKYIQVSTGGLRQGLICEFLQPETSPPKALAKSGSNHIS